MDMKFKVEMELYTHDKKPAYGTTFNHKDAFIKEMDVEELAKRIGEGRTVYLDEAAGLIMLDFDNVFTLRAFSNAKGELAQTMAFNCPDEYSEEFFEKYTELTSLRSPDYITCEEAISKLGEIGIVPVMAYHSFNSTPEHERFHILIAVDSSFEENYRHIDYICNGPCTRYNRNIDLFKTIFGTAIDSNTECVYFGTTPDKIAYVNHDPTIVKYEKLKLKCRKFAAPEIYIPRLEQGLILQKELEKKIPDLNKLICDTFPKDWEENTKVIGDYYLEGPSLLFQTLSCTLTKELDLSQFPDCIKSGFLEDFSNMQRVVLPEGIKQVPARAFFDCTSLKYIDIPDSVTEIGRAAFSNCESLENIIIPDSVTKIGESAFADCDSLTTITIPDGVTEIEEHTFLRCKNLESITIPDSVTKIGIYSFANCKNLSGITIPDSVTEIGIGAFYSCKSLRNVIIPDNTTEIGTQAFADVLILLFNVQRVLMPNNMRKKIIYPLNI